MGSRGAISTRANREDVVAELMLAPWFGSSGLGKQASKQRNFNLDSYLPILMAGIKFHLLDLAQTSFGVKLARYRSRA